MWPRDERPGVLETKQGAEAAAEFQKILDYRGWLLYTFASVGIARAALLQGDIVKHARPIRISLRCGKIQTPTFPSWSKPSRNMSN